MKLFVCSILCSALYPLLSSTILFCVAPGKPTFAVVGIYPTWINVTFSPSTSGVQGSVFYVQYRKTGRSNWDASREETSQRWINVTNLRPGTYYQIRVAARNGALMETVSDGAEIYTDPWGTHYFLYPLFHTTCPLLHTTCPLFHYLPILINPLFFTYFFRSFFISLDICLISVSYSSPSV